MSALLTLFGLLAFGMAAYILVSFLSEYGRPRGRGGRGGRDKT